MPYRKQDEANFDPPTSGQLVSEEAELIFELGVGDMIFFPSGLVMHWNKDFASKEERRDSVTFWSSANLESWADKGCKPGKKGAK